MTPAQEKCAQILRDSHVAQPQKHEFFKRVTAVEKDARIGRWGYPVLYAAFGGIVGCLFSLQISLDLKSKFFPALAAVFTALLAFYKPSHLVTQRDCFEHLEKFLPAIDLAEINKAIDSETDHLDKWYKLAAALISYGLIIAIAQT
jgi:hypothetical protein